MDTTDAAAPLRWTLTHNAPLQALNTFHVQASAAQLLELHDAALLPEVLALPEVANGPLLVLGSGSNVLIADDLPGTVLVFGNRDISFLEHRADHAVIRAGAGVPWHGLVMWSLQEGLSGLENLALIPGTAGAALVQCYRGLIFRGPALVSECVEAIRRRREAPSRGAVAPL